jgi:hypothetical protein
MMLTLLDRLPDGLLDTDAASLHRVLPGPTLIHLPGRRTEALFVSILLHGNEAVGLHAIQQVLSRYQGRELPRALALFVGNVDAARLGMRRTEHGPDYNRVWPGGEISFPDESAMMAEVVERMRARGVFASVDLHNNTGLNPHYACVNRLDAPFLQLAALFSRTVVYFLRPLGVQSMAFAELCPAVTCECGKTGDAAGAAHAVDFIDTLLHLSAIPAHAVREGDVHLFHTVATVRVDPNARIGFGAQIADIVFPADLDRLNFREVEPGARLARVADAGMLSALDEHGADATARHFRVRDGWIEFRRAVMPSMLTLDADIIRQDCLCYLMERHPLPG